MAATTQVRLLVWTFIAAPYASTALSHPAVRRCDRQAVRYARVGAMLHTWVLQLTPRNRHIKLWRVQWSFELAAAIKVVAVCVPAKCVGVARLLVPRRWLKAPVRKGVGSNPTAVN